MNSEEMYQEIILDSWRNPKNFGKIKNPDISFKDSNPSCGDIIQIDIKLNKNKIEEIKFNGSGCIISQAMASMLTDYVKNKNLNDIKKINKEEILKMLGINLSGMRIKCALLSLKVLKYGVYNYLGNNMEEDYG